MSLKAELCKSLGASSYKAYNIGAPWSPTGLATVIDGSSVKAFVVDLSISGRSRTCSMFDNDIGVDDVNYL